MYCLSTLNGWSRPADVTVREKSSFSLGTAKKVHVDADSYATASFTFAGTGFDVDVLRFADRYKHKYGGLKP